MRFTALPHLFLSIGTLYNPLLVAVHRLYASGPLIASLVTQKLLTPLDRELDRNFCPVPIKHIPANKSSNCK